MLDDAGAVVNVMRDSVFLLEFVNEFFMPVIIVDVKVSIFL